jgi:hypothetical protein
MDSINNKKSENPTSLSVRLIISVLFSIIAAIGWVMYSNQQDRNQVVDISDPKSAIQISSLKAYQDNEERIKQINLPDYQPTFYTKKSPYLMGCFYWMDQATQDEENSRRSMILNERAGRERGEPYDTTIKPSQYRKKYDECVKEEKANKATLAVQIKEEKISIEKELLEKREILRKQVKSDTTFKFLMAFGISFFILGAISFVQHLKSKPYN